MWSDRSDQSAPDKKPSYVFAPDVPTYTEQRYLWGEKHAQHHSFVTRSVTAVQTESRMMFFFSLGRGNITEKTLSSHYLYRYTSAKPFPSALNPPTATLSLRTASVFTFAMSCVCQTGIDSILQSSALPSVDRMCREITPSSVHVMMTVGSRKALSASGMSAFKHIRQGKDDSQCDNWAISNFRRKTHIFTQTSPFSGLLHGHPLISTQTDHQVSICGACSNGSGGRNGEAEHEGGRQRYSG